MVPVLYINNVPREALVEVGLNILNNYLGSEAIGTPY